ncbi:MAG: SAP domain-containing protein, partial [Candidatus Thermoplasmatota archaeon]|nr:SAP domain-containing protein [Candidatus Thermoplasmatota archaeon]
QWFQTTYEGVPSDLSALVPFNWTLALDTTSLSSGIHIVEIRASDSDGISLPVVLEIEGGGSAESAAGLSAYLFSLGIVLIVVFVSSVVLFLRTGDDDETPPEILEATLVSLDDELDGMTVAELKERLRSEGLSTSGKKSDLIQRLRDVPKSR